MFKNMKYKSVKQNLIFVIVLVFFVFAGILLIDGLLFNSQSEGVFLPAIRLVGEYKVGEGDWQTIVEGEHIPATKGDVYLKGTLEFGDFENGEVFGTVSPDTLIALNLNHINLSVLNGEEIIYVSDTENTFIGEDACGNVWMSFLYRGEDGYFEAVIHNSHKFGNETAVDDMLASMNVYVSDYFDKITLSSGKTERLIAIIIIIVAFIVLGLAIFSSILYSGIFRNTLFAGLLILSAGIFFLVTSRAFYLWFDTVIVNTMAVGLSVMAYVLFAILLIKELFNEKIKKFADVIIFLYTVLISVLSAVALFSEIYFFDLLSLWAVGAVAIASIFAALCLLSFNCVDRKKKLALILVILGIIAFICDVVSVYFGLWQVGLISKVYFLVGFVISLVTFLRIVPKNINAAKRAESLEREKITLDAELANSRISTLMSQIHPHFIYNTLGSIEQLCELDPPKAAKLVNDFSKYLRGNFGEIDNPKLIRVSKELEHTEYYISIEKVRFPDIDFVVEMNCVDFCLPALTIQPIVENAVKHGILKRQEGGTVKVRIYETDCSYFISVKDDGVGFDVAQIEQNNHVGLRNIKSRLEAMCGGMLNIESIIGVGTKITVEIPKETV